MFNCATRAAASPHSEGIRGWVGVGVEEDGRVTEGWHSVRRSGDVGGTNDRFTPMPQQWRKEGRR